MEWLTILEVKINREIRNYTESMFFGLSLRQFVFSLLAVGVAVGLYFLLRPYLGTETVSWVCILGAAPFAALGFVSYHGMTAEQPRRSRFIATVCAVCPDSIEKHSDYLKLGDQYCRFFLKDYASDIKDAMVTDRTNW